MGNQSPVRLAHAMPCPCDVVSSIPMPCRVVLGVEMQRGGPALSERRPLARSITSKKQPCLAVWQSVTLPIMVFRLASSEVFRGLNFSRPPGRHWDSSSWNRRPVEATRAMRTRRDLKNSLGNARRRSISLYRSTASRPVPVSKAWPGRIGRIGSASMALGVLEIRHFGE